MGKLAAAPFNHPLASLVLRTSDNVDFHVFREILLMASPFFETMLSLPQVQAPKDDNPNDHDFKEGLPVVVVEEDEECLDYLLRLCYPLPAPPSLESVSVAERVLRASMKYEIRKVTLSVQPELITLGKSDPFRLYAFSCSVGFEDGAMNAARMLYDVHKPVARTFGGFPNLSTTGFSLPYKASPSRTVNESNFCELVGTLTEHPPLVPLSPGCLFRLVRYLCSGAKSSFSSPAGVEGASQSPEETASTSDYIDGAISHDFPHDAVIRSSDAVDFPVHQLLLRITRVTGVDATQHGGEPGALPVIEVTEDSRIVRALLFVCYNPGEASKDTFPPEVGIRMWTLAVAVGMEGVAKAIKAWLLSCADASPLLAYFIATACGWNDEALHAARRFALTGNPLSDGYDPAMDTFASLDSYTTLIKFFHRAAIAQYKLISDISSDLPSPALVKGWYDMALIRPSPMSPGLVLRTLADTKNADSKPYIQEQSYDKEPIAFGRQLLPSSAALNELLNDAVLQVSV